MASIYLTMQGQEAENSLSGKITAEGGIKADVVFLNFLKTDAPGATSTFIPGGSLGGFADISFTELISLKPEVNINFKQTEFGWENNKGKLKSLGIEVPIYVVFNWKFRNRHMISYGLGPYTEFCYHALWERDGRKVDLLAIDRSGNPMIQDTQSGLATFLSYEFSNGIGLNIAYRICAYNILQPNSSQGVSLYPQTASIGMSYRFRKSR